jgi:hypothetical protein
MKKIVITLIMGSMVLGLFLTGCSKDEKNTKNESETEVTKEEIDAEIGKKNVSDTEVDMKIIGEIEELYPDMDIDIEIVKQIIPEIDIDLDAESKEHIMESLGNLLKYEVSDLDYEGYENEVYDLSYFTEADLEDIVVYFHMLLSDSPNYAGGMYEPEMGIGAAIKGEVNGLTTVVQIDAQEDEEFYISIFCRQD